MQKIYDAISEVEAQLIHDFLEEKGIWSQYAPRGPIGWERPIPIYVEDDKFNNELHNEIDRFVVNIGKK